MSRGTIIAVVLAVVLAVAVVSLLAVYSRPDGTIESTGTLPRPLEPQRRATPTPAAPPAARNRLADDAPTSPAADLAPPLPAPSASLAESAAPTSNESPGADPLPGGDFAASRSRLAERFNGESRDPTVSVALERELLDRIARQPGLALTNLDVECRTTTCKVQLVSPDAAGELRNISFEGFSAIGNAHGGADGSLIMELLLVPDVRR